MSRAAVAPAPTPDAWSFYVVRCGDGSLYAGIAKDARARFRAHAEGKGAKYTRGRGPLELLRVVVCGAKGDALAVEARFKRRSRAEKLRLVGRRARLAAFARRVVDARALTR